MKFFRRSLIALGVAAMLPTVVFLAVGTFLFLRAESRRVESDTLGRAQMLTTLADARLRGDVAALNMLTGSSSLYSRNWAEFYERLRPARAANPHWATIALYDAQDGRTILDLREPFGTTNDRRLDAEVLRRLKQTKQAVVGNVRIETEPLAYVYVPHVTDGEVHFV